MGYHSRGKRASLLAVILLLVVNFGCGVEEEFKQAKTIADRVHVQMQAGDYVSIYQQAGPGFRSSGSEAQFVLLMQDFVHQHGPIIGVDQTGHEIGVDSTAGKVHVLTFDLRFQKMRAKERIIVSAVEGGMKLWKLEIEPQM